MDFHYRKTDDWQAKLEAELAEARAQIADLKEHTDAMKEYVATADEMLAEARAQIAAKDAALRKLRHWLYEEEEAHAGEIAMIDAVLAAPARETK